GGHGGYRNIVLAPSSVPEMASFPALAFSLAFKHRTPVIILTDAFLGQLKEDLMFPEVPALEFDTSWATTGARGPERHVISSMHLDLPELSRHSEHLRAKIEEVDRSEQRSEKFQTDDADVILVAYGICARLCQRAVGTLRAKGVRVGLLRPITLSPFPKVELNTGQMIQDVQLATGGRAQVGSLQRVGGLIPSPSEIVHEVEGMVRGSTS